MAGQTIIKNYIEQKIESAAPNASQLLSFLKSPRAQKELDNSANRSIDARLGAEYRYYRSRPSLAFHMTREITRQLIFRNPPRMQAHSAPDAQIRIQQVSEERGGQNEKTKIVREEFILTPKILKIISDKVAYGIFRSIELERLRKGL